MTDLLRKTTHTTMGIPSNAVMALIGRVNILETRSQRSSTAAPERTVPGTSTRWSLLRNSILVTWGMASPMKPIGPQKAVTVPASSVVERNSSPRERRMFSPIVTAYSSPNSSKLSGLIVTTANNSPAIIRYLSVSYPLQRIRITSPYGYRKDPFTGKRKFHGGIDLHARGEQVLAMMEGVVVKVGQDKTSGKYVTLRHGNYTVSYCHLSRVLAAKGTVVRPRDAVGITGSTGRSTGEHLHVTCKLNGKNINPSVLFDYIKSMQQECVSALAGLL